MSIIKEIELDGFKALNISNDFISITTIPSLGGKIVSVEDKKSGFDFAFKNPHIKNYSCKYASDFSNSSASGIDECFPTVALSKYTEYPWENIEIPDHGEIWSQEMETEVIGKTIVQKAHGVRFPYIFNRAINLEDNSLFLNYRVENLSNFDFKYAWSIHPHFILLENTEIHMENGTDIFVDFTKTNDFQLKTLKYKWPILETGDNKSIDFSKITAIDNGQAEKLYACNLKEGRVKLCYPDQKESITFKFNSELLSYCGIWIDHGGWPFNDNPYKVLAIEPCNCITDRFEDSVARRAFDVVKAKSYKEWKLDLIIE
jgi:hypothetical protein